MKRLVSGVAMALLMSQTSAVAAVQRPDARIIELQKRIAKMKPSNRGETYSSICLEYVEQVNRDFSGGTPKQVQADLAGAVQSAQDAVAAASEHKHKIKETEIHLREAVRRLNEVARSLSVDDRPAVTDAADVIDKARLKLFDVMFSKDKR